LKCLGEDKQPQRGREREREWDERRGGEDDEQLEAVAADPSAAILHDAQHHDDLDGEYEPHRRVPRDLDGVP
jgi:hypothetical protein